MSIQDPISDMIVRIKNATLMKKTSVSMQSSNTKVAIAQCLLDEGYIEAFHVDSDGAKKQLTITLKYYEGQAVIANIKRVSTPGCRVYKPIKRVAKVIGGYGITILSTSKGVISDSKARLLGVGGEILCTVF